MSGFNYDGSSIRVLEGLAAVRMRPGYIGDTGLEAAPSDLEIVGNSVDEALAGYCTGISVALAPDRSVLSRQQAWYARRPPAKRSLPVP